MKFYTLLLSFSLSEDLIPLRKGFGVDAISMLGNGYLYLH
ncbi:hypothetical protein ES319_A10G215400v1 [Gossypium barbadense]|uniref:Uncharacterized protein n=1 Tax=Gossypium barbadense TaxID=3634 RepID=A0A5J5UA37_GOSBA|nr:hypothetical protein ES319_A10G215400v1 [Gossypium barbadense]